MGEPQVAENGIAGSNALLSEILDVLKRIDGHLEVQDNRINELDTKFASLTASKDSNTISTIPPEISLADSGGARRGSVYQASPLARRRGLALLTSSRHVSLDSRHAPDSLRHFPLDEGRDLGPNSRKNSGREQRQRSDITKSIVPESPTGRRNSIPKITPVSRSGTWNSLAPPPTSIEMETAGNVGDIDELSSYSKYPPPQSWIATRFQGRFLDVKYNSVEAQNLWKQYVGDSWTIPPDGRIEMTFQRHLLERLDKGQVVSLLETLQGVAARLEYGSPTDLTKRGSFKVTDYEFDPNFEESVAEYRADIPIGKFRKHRVNGSTRKRSIDLVQSAPWKRIIEVRGLSKKLIDEHETWTSNFRDPWNEALPIINPICPFLTSRMNESTQEGFTGMRTVHEALFHHQQCWRRPPPCDDNLCFHITFYELIDLTREHELEGELWRSGKLHSEEEKEVRHVEGTSIRRIRESACTIVAVVDATCPTYFTILYLCPNSFELYDKTHNFEQYDTITTAIKGRDAASALELMIESTIRMVIERWDKLAEYFSKLLGHRDTLSDPDAHDSLLFDDDSFSRSRKYFWAINYLAELDISISANIVELEKLAIGNKSLREQLKQLLYLRERIRDQRDEAIALRDGLFSASGVIESRASTRLGENIKLLTFVSIFFLPLSFCMSLWSINTTLFSLHSLIITVIFVGFGTYLTVFNLNNVVRFWSRAYKTYKMKLIQQMATHSDDKWREIGKRFATFQPKQETTEPSEWAIMSFVMRKIFMGFNTRAKADERDGEGEKQRQGGGLPAFSDWNEMPFPGEIGPTKGAEQEEDANKGSEVDHNSSIKNSITRLNKFFRRGAFAPNASAEV